jgi:catechol 2,3-dioxygenase-like lactoylglutathione lyase family enzyme
VNAAVERVSRVVLNAPDASALARFYVEALGFVDAFPGTLSLGATRLEIVDAPGGAYPPHVPGWSPLFQHFAIVVDDIDAAMRALDATTGWSPISTAGPETLPANTGGVTAFKFRDPVGHPLELLSIPDEKSPARGPFLRIDHSAISVADIARSIAFYEALGFRVANRSLNAGIEQERLDAIEGAELDVVSLAAGSPASLRIELLGYRGAYDRGGIVPAPAVAVAATRLVLDVGRPALAAIGARLSDRIVQRSAETVLLRDPDGHLLQFETAR